MYLHDSILGPSLSMLLNDFVDAPPCFQQCRRHAALLPLQQHGLLPGPGMHGFREVH